MNPRRIALFAMIAFVIAAPSCMAQIIPGSASLVFSMDGTELAASPAGVGMTNETAIFSDDSILNVSPNPFAPVFAVASADFGTWAAYFGDDDGNGSYTGSIIGDVDALYMPPGGSLPASIFNVFLSFQVDVAPGGILTNSGVGIDDGDVVRLLPRGGFVPFILRTQIADAMATTSTSIDVNGFSVDSSNGDIYLTFTATQSVNGTSASDGSVIRIPGSGYIANPDGTVQSVTTGSAEIVLSEADVDAIFLNAGLNGITDCFGIAMDPFGGTFLSPQTGTAMANLWLVDDDASDGPSIVTTSGGGGIATLGPSIFNDPASLGLAPTNFFGGAVGNLSALTFFGSPLPARPLHLDTFPLAVTTPGTVTIDVSGGSPGPNVMLIAKFGEASIPASFTYRWSIFLSMLPMFDVPGGFDELYINDNTDILTLTLMQAPPLVVDADGYASRSFTVPALPPGMAVAFQAYDISTEALSTPIIPVFQ